MFIKLCVRLTISLPYDVVWRTRPSDTDEMDGCRRRAMSRRQISNNVERRGLSFYDFRYFNIISLWKETKSRIPRFNSTVLIGKIRMDDLGPTVPPIIKICSLQRTKICSSFGLIYYISAQVLYNLNFKFQTNSSDILLLISSLYFNVLNTTPAL